MFGSLTEKFKNLASKLMGQKQLTAASIAEAAREVRQALLDADVNFSIANTFVQRVQEKAVGERVLKAVSQGEQFVEIVHEELIALMGGEEAHLKLVGRPAVVMLCGLQGSGKTTTAAKLAYFLRDKKVLVAACDLHRPAAVEQLKTVCQAAGVLSFAVEGEKDPVRVAQQALQQAKEMQADVLIVDTAGRLHIDAELMHELGRMKEVLRPDEILFVASAHAGQDATAVVKAFDEQMAITGSILTMLDGTARAGAAISIREVTQKPLKFEGIGERVADLQPFNPRSMADRILGMGDIVNLVRRAKVEFDEKEGQELESKLRKAAFTYSDFLKQLKAMKKMGPLKGLLQMIPGAAALPNVDQSEQEFKRIEAIILSMTPQEREEKVELVPSRRWRIAKGSGTTVDHVNKLIKQFRKMKDVMKTLSKSKQPSFNLF